MHLDATRQMVHIFDISQESVPLGVSTWTVKESSGRLLQQGRALWLA